MSQLIEWLGEKYPDDVISTPAGGFVDSAISLELVNAAERSGVPIYSIEAFLVGSDGVGYPVTGRRRDLLDLDQMDCESLVSSTCGAARQILTTVWAEPPTLDMTKCLHDDIECRSMICFVID